MVQVGTERAAADDAAVTHAPPGWLRLSALAGAGGVLCFGLVGLFLAENGWYRPALAFPLGGLCLVGVLALTRPAWASKSQVSRSAHVYAGVGVALILAITVWNAAHASQHVMINRDGGSYANTARWIARDGSLSVKPRVGPFAHEPTVGFDSFAVYQMRDGSLQFQFAHLLPVVLAEAFAIRGDAALFHAAEVLGGIALLAFYVLAWRLFRRPLFALAAMLALAFIIPQVSFSRDSYSEIPSQILLFTAIGLLVGKRLMPHWRIAFASGLFLGALEGVRIDAVVFLIGLPVLFAAAFLRAERGPDRRAAATAIGACVAGLVPGMAIGLIDLTRHSGGYYADLSDNLHLLFLAVVGSAVSCALVVAAWPRLWLLLRRLPWPAISTLAALIVAFVGFFAWLVRPRIQHLHGKGLGLVSGLQAAEHVAVDGTRLYYERSLVWMAWYLGPLTVAAAIIGAALLARELLRGRMTRALAVLVVLAPGTIFYLYRADAASDHVWVTRRFLVSAFPLLVLLALGLAATVAGVRASRQVAIAARVGAIAFAIVAVAFPLYTIRNVTSMSEERGFLAVVHDTCADLGKHAAVVVLERDEKDLFDDWIPQSLRSWCGAEVGVTRGPAHADALRELARKWNAQGRPLFVVASSADAIDNVLPGVGVRSTPRAFNTKFLAQSLTHRPDRYQRQSFAMAVAQVPVG